MAANINDKLTAVMNGGQPVVTTVSSPRSAGVTTLSCVALTYWPTVTKVHLITYRKTAAGNVDRATQQNWMGIVSGNTITGLVKTDDAADAGNSAGEFVEMTPTAKWGQDLYDGLAASHDNDGTLKAGAVDVAAVLASNVVETAKIKDKAVTLPKINGGTTAGVLTTDASGNVTSQNISFHARPSSAQTIGTGGVKVNYGTADFNYGGDYNTTTSTFTAPVSGIYHFDACVFNTTGTATEMMVRLITAGSRAITYRGNWIPITNYRVAVVSATIKLTASDTVTVDAYTGAGTIIGAAVLGDMYFSGYLVSRI